MLINAKFVDAWMICVIVVNVYFGEHKTNYGRRVSNISSQHECSQSVNLCKTQQEQIQNLQEF